LNQLLRDTCGLHATGAINPYLALFARMEGFQREDLERALYHDRMAVKIRCLRKTIFVHDRSTLPVYFAASVREVRAASEKFMKARGISAGRVECLTKRILELLEGRELSAAEIALELEYKDNLSPVLYYLCDSGILVRGRPVSSWRDKRVHYAVFAEWFPDVDLEEWEESEARVEVVRAYLRAFGPVSEEDILWWTGFGKRRTGQALEHIQSELIQVRLEDRDRVYWLHEQDRELLESDPKEAGSPTVNLLPNLDSYLMGYKLRERYLTPEILPYTFDRAGNITSTILLDGRIVGVWDVEQNGGARVKLHFFQDLGSDSLDEVYAQANRLGWFITDQEAEIRQCAWMQPLTERSMGGIMTPLKGSS
jgi:hypothetical protein